MIAKNQEELIKRSKQYRIHKISILIFIYWLFILAAAFSIKGRVRFGIGNDIKIANITINTWGKYAMVICYIVFGQMINTISNYTIQPFYDNVIRDYKTKTIPYTRKRLMMLRANYSIYEWIHGIVKLFVCLSLEVQFYIVMMGTDLLFDLLLHWLYIHKKGFYTEDDILPDTDDEYDSDDVKDITETFTLL